MLKIQNIYYLLITAEKGSETVLDLRYHAGDEDQNIDSEVGLTD